MSDKPFPPKPSDRLAYTITEAANATTLSPDTIYRLHADGEITLRKVGHRTLVMRADLLALLESLPKVERRSVR